MKCQVFAFFWQWDQILCCLRVQPLLLTCNMHVTLCLLWMKIQFTSSAIDHFVDVTCSDSETCNWVHSIYEQKERVHPERHWRNEEAESVSQTARWFISVVFTKLDHELRGLKYTCVQCIIQSVIKKTYAKTQSLSHKLYMLISLYERHIYCIYYACLCM